MIGFWIDDMVNGIDFEYVLHLVEPFKFLHSTLLDISAVGDNGIYIIDVALKV